MLKSCSDLSSSACSRRPSYKELERWNAVKADRDREEARALAASCGGATDNEATALRRQLEVEEWKEEQLRSGKSAANPNFTPTVGWFRMTPVCASME